MRGKILLEALYWLDFADYFIIRGKTSILSLNWCAAFD
jgi:hypothetical protein